jgi:hypothetical protein
MLHLDYHVMNAQASDRRRELEQAVANERLLPQNDQPGLHLQALAKIGDALIAGGTRLKAAADNNPGTYRLKPEQGGA